MGATFVIHNKFWYVRIHSLRRHGSLMVVLIVHANPQSILRHHRMSIGLIVHLYLRRRLRLLILIFKESVSYLVFSSFNREDAVTTSCFTSKLSVSGPHLHLSDLVVVRLSSGWVFSIMNRHGKLAVEFWVSKLKSLGFTIGWLLRIILFHTLIVWNIISNFVLSRLLHNFLTNLWQPWRDQKFAVILRMDRPVTACLRSPGTTWLILCDELNIWSSLVPWIICFTNEFLIMSNSSFVEILAFEFQWLLMSSHDRKLVN